MNAERKIAALAFALEWVAEYEGLDSDQTTADAVKLIGDMLEQVEIAKRITDLTAEFAQERPDLSRDVIRKHVAAAVRKTSKVAA